MRIWLQRNHNSILIILVAIILVSGLVITRRATSGRDYNFHCYICEGLRHHAPCLIDLSTGDILELSVYENDPVRQGELAETQTTGYFSFIGSGDMMAAKDAGNSCQVTLPVEQKTMNASLFCEKCQASIRSISNKGIIMADLYNLENIDYYLIKENAEYSFRDYQISITKIDSSEQLSIYILGIK